MNTRSQTLSADQISNLVLALNTVHSSGKQGPFYQKTAIECVQHIFEAHSSGWRPCLLVGFS